MHNIHIYHIYTTYISHAHTIHITYTQHTCTHAQYAHKQISCVRHHHTTHFLTNHHFSPILIVDVPLSSAPAGRPVEGHPSTAQHVLPVSPHSSRTTLLLYQRRVYHQGRHAHHECRLGQHGAHMGLSCSSVHTRVRYDFDCDVNVPEQR